MSASFRPKFNWLLILIMCACTVPASGQLELVSPQMEDIATTPVTDSLARPIGPVATVRLRGVPLRAAIPVLPPRHYGFFCRIEDRNTRKTGIVPRFRLGSSTYVNWLEGKSIDPRHVTPK